MVVGGDGICLVCWKCKEERRTRVGKRCRHTSRRVVLRRKQLGDDLTSTPWRYDKFWATHSGVPRWFWIFLHAKKLLGFSRYESLIAEDLNGDHIAAASTFQYNNTSTPIRLVLEIH